MEREGREMEGRKKRRGIEKAVGRVMGRVGEGREGEGRERTIEVMQVGINAWRDTGRKGLLFMFQIFMYTLTRLQKVSIVPSRPKWNHGS